MPVFLIHDLIPITHPEYCRAGEAERHQYRMEAALRLSRGLVFNSEATLRELDQFAKARGLAMSPCVVAWLGTDTKPTTSAVNPAGNERRPYFVMVGTIEARKNHLLILEAWRDIAIRLGERTPDLVIIGQRGWEAAEAIDILDNPGPPENRVREISRCDDLQMAEFLADAQAMLMPSFVEGFGLPVVEALQQGIPVIASDLPVFREIAGDVPTYLDPNDRKAWVDAVIDYMDDSVERERQLTAMGSFSPTQWNDHFALVDEFLDTL